MFSFIPDLSSQVPLTCLFHHRDALLRDPFCGEYFSTAYLDTEPYTLGKAHHKKVTPLVSVSFKRTEQTIAEGEYDFPSSCFMSARWDFNQTQDIDKLWQNTQQAYRLKDQTTDSDNGVVQARDVIMYRARVRGRGNSVSLRFEQEQGKDFQLLGYTIDFQIRGRM